MKEAILASDAILSMFSTVLVESLYLNRPSISIQPGLKVEDPLITNELGITLPIYRENEIPEVLSKLASDPDFQNKLAEKRAEFSKAQKATPKIKKLILETIAI